MGKTHIDNLQAGMILTEDVHDRSGRLLLGAGAELQNKHIVIFRTWGVIEAAVGDEVSEQLIIPAGLDIDLDRLAAVEEELKPRYRYADLNQPAIRELLRLNAMRRLTHGL